MTQSSLQFVPDPRVVQQVAEHPFPLLFATISGAHLYGFPSPDSDYDIRGAHAISLAEAVSLWPDQHDTVQVTGVRDGLEIDLVTHDLRKFFGLMLKKNGYVMEQVFSPLIVRTTPEHDELKAIAKQCLTRHHVHHAICAMRRDCDDGCQADRRGWSWRAERSRALRTETLAA